MKKDKPLHKLKLVLYVNGYIWTQETGKTR